jgi:hypothetical protein
VVAREAFGAAEHIEFRPRLSIFLAFSLRGTSTLICAGIHE